MKKRMEACCTKCGRELDMFDKQSGLSVDRFMGFGSSHDGERLLLRLCCACTDELAEWCGAFGNVDEETDEKSI